MQNIHSNIASLIFPLLEDTQFRRVCKSWSLYFPDSFITSKEVTNKLRRIPLTPLIISRINNLDHKKREWVLVAINRPFEVEAIDFQGIDGIIIRLDANNYMGKIIKNIDTYEERTLHSPYLGQYYSDPLIILIIDLLYEDAINCLVSLRELVDKDRFTFCFGGAITFLRSGTEKELEVNLSAIIVPMMKNFPYFQPTYDEVLDLIECAEDEEEIEDLVYVLGRGWFNKLEKEFHHERELLEDVPDNYLKIREIYMERNGIENTDEDI